MWGALAGLAGSLLSDKGSDGNGGFMSNINPMSSTYKKDGKFSVGGWKDWFMKNLTGDIFGGGGGGGGSAASGASAIGDAYTQGRIRNVPYDANYMGNRAYGTQSGKGSVGGGVDYGSIVNLLGSLMTKRNQDNNFGSQRTPTIMFDTQNKY